MELLLLSAADLRAALPMADAIAAMKQAFAAYSTGQGAAPPRLHLETKPQEGIVLSMAGQVPGEGLVVKVVSVFPKNAQKNLPLIHGLVLVLDEETGEPRALCEGSALTALRTGAASGAATDLLARPEVSVGAVLGGGIQGKTQLQAICCARPLREVRVFDVDPDRVRAFIADVRPTVEARLVAADSAEEAAEGAEVICSATPAREPIVAGDCIAPGTHINAVGSFTLEMGEWDDGLIGRARVFVDSREAASLEAGELVRAEQAGQTQREQWTELGEVVTGGRIGRQTDTEITLFKSVGLAVQDAAAAGRALRAAVEQGLGRRVEL
jgi:alanine dehydrogenase